MQRWADWLEALADPKVTPLPKRKRGWIRPRPMPSHCIP